jgi:hypothetical protein
MNVIEGARRMQTAGRWMAFTPVCLGLLFICLSLVIANLPLGRNSLGFPLFAFVPLLLPIGIIGVFLWIAGWIVEGFAQKSD